MGLTVIRLKRTEIAGIKLGMLQQGKWRELNEKRDQKADERQRFKGVSEG